MRAPWNSRILFKLPTGVHSRYKLVITCLSNSVTVACIQRIFYGGWSHANVLLTANVLFARNSLLMFVWSHVSDSQLTPAMEAGRKPGPIFSLHLPSASPVAQGRLALHSRLKPAGHWACSPVRNPAGDLLVLRVSLRRIWLSKVSSGRLFFLKNFWSSSWLN